MDVGFNGFMHLYRKYQNRKCHLVCRHSYLITQTYTQIRATLNICQECVTRHLEISKYPGLEFQYLWPFPCKNSLKVAKLRKILRNTLGMMKILRIVP